MTTIRQLCRRCGGPNPPTLTPGLHLTALRRVTRCPPEGWGLNLIEPKSANVEAGITQLLFRLRRALFPISHRTAYLLVDQKAVDGAVPGFEIYRLVQCIEELGRRALSFRPVEFEVVREWIASSHLVACDACIRSDRLSSFFGLDGRLAVRGASG